MDRKKINKYVENLGLEVEGVIVPDGLDGAFLGVYTEGDTPCAVYSIDKCISILSEQMPKEEASEYFWFNVAGAGGKGYPLYISTPSEDVSPYD
tara:strand:- start:694 stop:975 length:282 start_codon:yes stop_codon:yes gene_type:complete